MVGVPVIINHKDINKDNADDLRVGVVNSVWYDEKDGWYWCDGIIWDETAQNLITDKNWSVSCSYDVKTADNKGGSENNIKYDMEFLDGVFTHLALVNNPRYERANIVFNSKTYNVDNAEKEFVTVGEGDSAHAIPVEYLEKGKQWGGLDEEEYDRIAAEYNKIRKQDKILSPQQVKEIKKYYDYFISHSKYMAKFAPNEPTKKYYSELVTKSKDEQNRLDDWFDLSKHQEKHFRKYPEWAKYYKNHPEEFKNSITNEKFTDIFFEALAEVILENKEQ